MFLHDYLVHSTDRHGDRVAVREPDGREVSYRELSRLSDGVRDVLSQAGVGPGDRVGCFMRKSVDAVATERAARSGLALREPLHRKFEPPEHLLARDAWVAALVQAVAAAKGASGV